MKNKSSVFFLFLTVLFFLSGACGLAYEMIWVRKLGLIFGNTTFAISTILAVFMGGLGLGSLFFGRQIDKKGNPLFWYAFLEIGIGLFCFFTPWLWVFIEMFYVWVYQAAHLSFWQFSLFRFLLCFAFLFIPTFLMGGTLPVLTKFLIRDCRQTTKVVGFLYGVNTLGAVLGVLVTSFFAIYVLGLNGTVFVTSGINVLIGLAMFFLLRLKVFLAGDRDQLKGASLPISETVDIQDDSQGRLSQEKLLVILLAAFAFSGFTSMAYELCWTKVLALCLGSSVYSFALMLASFLTGLALGSLLIGWLAKKIPINLYVFGLAQIFVALFVLWGVNTFDQMPFYFLQFFILFGKNSLVFHVSKFVLASVIILLPTICIGCTFAIVAQMLNRSSAKTGETIGRAYFINTLGCIAGSICSGFILVPWIGIFTTFLVMVVLNFFIGIIILFVSQKRFSLLQTMIAAIAIIAAGIFFFQAHPWSESLLTTNIAISPRTYLGYSKFELLSGIQQTESLYYKEGLSGVVSVKRHNDSVSLSINANVDASTGTDMHTQLMLGHLPILLAENPKRALVIGMGSGVTLGALATYDYRELHCVELEGAVVEAAKYFSKENRNVLSDPRLKNFVNDGRNHLLVEHFVYDVIVSEPSSPWMAGVASLFTVEQFELMKKRLSPKGVACQWLNVYSMSPRNVQMIVKTFRKVFPHTSLWITNGPDLLLIGSKQPIIYDVSAINQMIKKNIFLAKDLKDFKIYDALGLLSCFLLSDQELNMITEDAPINSDNFPFLEYSAPLNLYGVEKVVLQNKAMIISRRIQRYPAMTSFPQNKSEKIDFHNKLARAFLQKNNFYEASVEIGLSNKEEALNKGVVLNYGILQVIGGNADEAITNLGNYLKEDPVSADACFYMAKAYDLKQLFDKALTYYQMAAQREPDNPEYLFAYGESLVKNGNVAEGINFLQKVIDIKGLDFRNGLFLSQALVANQQFESAIKVLELLLKEYPHFYTLYEAMAGCYQALGQDSEAIFVYHEASKKLPFNARVYYALSLLYQKTGQIKESRKMARRYLYYQNAPKIGTLQQSL